VDTLEDRIRTRPRLRHRRLSSESFAINTAWLAVSIAATLLACCATSPSMLT
jgi:hypothetical protein